MRGDLEVELIDFIDLINNTLSKDFVEQWRHKYSEKFIKLFQFKILDSLNKQKPLKLTTLYSFLTKKHNYSPEQVTNFFDTIDIDLYRPLIKGRLNT